MHFRECFAVKGTPLTYCNSTRVTSLGTREAGWLACAMTRFSSGSAAGPSIWSSIPEPIMDCASHGSHPFPVSTFTSHHLCHSGIIEASLAPQNKGHRVFLAPSFPNFDRRLPPEVDLFSSASFRVHINGNYSPKTKRLRHRPSILFASPSPPRPGRHGSQTAFTRTLAKWPAGGKLDTS